MDKFYEIVTGDKDAFYKMCMVLPNVIEEVIEESKDVKVPEDTVIEELKKVAEKAGKDNEELSMAMAVYMLGFSTYNGFSEDGDERMLNRLYEYAKRLNN